jgi:heme oxygenase
METQIEDPFAPHVVAAVTRHMNADHADDSLVIVRALGGEPGATAAEMAGMTPRGIQFRTEVGNDTTVVEVPWSEPITSRAQIRVDVVRMYDDACAALRAAQPFSQFVRERTQSAHSTAETDGFMQALLDGRLPIESYGEMVAQLSLVYDVIDAAGATLRDDPTAGPFVFDQLERRDAFTTDLDYLLGPDRAPTEAMPATARYVERLNEVSFAWPGGYIAHHYTRYMGDLSGGQMIRVALARAFGLENNEGLRSLTFDRIADRNEFKNEYRRRLDALAWDPAEQDRFVDEVLLAYRFNTEIITDLGARYRAAIEA